MHVQNAVVVGRFHELLGFCFGFFSYLSHVGHEVLKQRIATLYDRPS